MNTTLSAKTRKTFGGHTDYMARRMELLQHISDCGPMRKHEIALPGSWTDAIKWLSEQGLISTETSGARSWLYSITPAGLRKLRAPDGAVTPPPTRPMERWAPVRDLAWPTVRPGAEQASGVQSLGEPT
jgi:hypothetical protein